MQGGGARGLAAAALKMRVEPDIFRSAGHGQHYQDQDVMDC